MDAIQERDDDDIDWDSGKSKGSKSDDDKVDATGKESLVDSREPSDSKLLQVEVSILDLDRDGSVNLDKDSDDEARRQEEALGPVDGSDISSPASQKHFFKTITDSVDKLEPVDEDVDTEGNNEDGD
mmetsp:Transcript_17376/g.21928  ORF Transcript_17376/g.21928 Transcript_17376/m.21928 type:complete len:127 (-) Transcript_17376:39-419(-)